MQQVAASANGYAISRGRLCPGTQPRTVQRYDPTNNVTVVVNPQTDAAVTVRFGPPSGKSKSMTDINPDTGRPLCN